MYHEGVMDGSHVLRLGCHVIGMFRGYRVVKNTDLRGQRVQPHPHGRTAGDHGGGGKIHARIVMRSLETDLQNELIAGVSTVEFRAGESELPVRQGGRSGVPVVHLPQRLLIARHGVHALGNTPQGQNAKLEIISSFFLACDITTDMTI